MSARDLAEWESTFKQQMGAPNFAAWFQRMVPLVESGRRDFYTVVG